MVKYPSSAVEQTRECIYSSNNSLETVLLLTCLVKNGMREDKKKNLLSECISCSNLSEEEIITLYEILDINSIYGYRMSPDQRRLGWDKRGQYRHEEFLVGKAVETMLGVRLYRSDNPRFDFVKGGQNWELIGPVAPFYFDGDSFVHSLSNHMCNKIGIDTLVVCTMTLPTEEQKDIKKLLKRNCTNGIDIFILDKECQDTSLQGYNFLVSSN